MLEKTQPTEQQEPQDPNGQAAEAQQPDKDWKALARMWEDRAKGYKAKADKLDEIEEASKSELQKAQEAAQQAESELAALKKAAQIDQWKQEVAKESGVPADVLSGETKAEIEAHAERIRPLIVAPASPTVPTDGTHPAVKGDARTAFAELIHSL